MKINNRMNTIKEYHFKKIEENKKVLINQGKEIIDLSIGDPDLPVEKSIVQALENALCTKNYNNYPPYDGIIQLKNEIINYYKQVFNVSLVREEVLILIGSKEGISNIIPAVCDFGDTLIMPEPAYPVYETCSRLWGTEPYTIPLKESHGYLPDLSAIPDNIRRKAKLFFINYPNNPTGAIANDYFYKYIVNYCIDNDIVLCNDGAYNEIIMEKRQPLSLLQFDPDKKFIEFGSFSKTYNMTGFRIGYVVGNRNIIDAICKVKSNLDSGQFIPIQLAAVAALKLDRNYVDRVRKVYDKRREIAISILNEKNIKVFSGGGTFYIWCKIPHNYTTDEFCEELLDQNGLIVTPGYCFGNSGYGYFRISLTKSCGEIEKTLKKLKKYE
ncbi:aminotransferase class I/II-fold pyridoxal phosphate-dependent enzyme [Clostridium sp. JN-9]|uniref:aminotransferase class I/II-fold pyridoxal phosphate-dependent enzyme n=1 Tax=Clostridium sp. JN-9 TaxID=2507159 RepID=UPI000FFE160A|nr:aminotransferase class I/II-fold pyridoxal phosphate-dependent enzyme [Clostridium sp. JN-9]QAT40137.1 aminotransferase class I/II-fold pyridoxal phosphate-dependent enzyme [Clostridium sp. JN-9]